MDYLKIYSNFLKKYLKPQRKLKVVFDCSNGTTGKVLKELFRKPRAKRVKPKVTAIFLNAKSDGNFPGHGPNPMAAGATRQLEKAVKKHRADLGVIFDADGDRMFLIDDLGRAVSPDETGYILLQELKPKKYVISVISGWLLKHQVSGVQHQAIISRVGHYFFKKLMREKRIALGMEHSGHYYFSVKGSSAAGGGNAYFDSGILAAIQIINFVSKLPMPLSEYLNKLPKYYRSGEINIKYQASGIKYQDILKKAEKFYKKSAKKISKLDGLTMEFPDYWLNVRPSNTENLLRLNIEATSSRILKEKTKEIKKIVKN